MVVEGGGALNCCIDTIRAGHFKGSLQIEVCPLEGELRLAQIVLASHVIPPLPQGSSSIFLQLAELSMQVPDVHAVLSAATQILLLGQAMPPFPHGKTVIFLHDVPLSFMQAPSLHLVVLSLTIQLSSAGQVIPPLPQGNRFGF